MKREEQQEQSRNRILQAAIKEYGSKAFSETSINSICNEDGISKGLVYHYFGNVDGLFLACVKMCFDKLEAFLKENISLSNENRNDALNSFFSARYTFFEQNPLLCNIFIVAMFQAPSHLQNEIKNLHKSLEHFNKNFIHQLIGCFELRKGFAKEESAEYIMAFFNFYVSSFHSTIIKDFTQNDQLALSKYHMTKFMDMLLYGIFVQEK